MTQVAVQKGTAQFKYVQKRNKSASAWRNMKMQVGKRDREQASSKTAWSFVEQKVTVPWNIKLNLH